MKRPRQHVIADKGVSAVMALCHECGWACDVVHSDYGEDLIVQSSHEGEVDSFRILLQVKATEQSQPKKIWIDRSHALRWLRSREPVMVAVWSVKTKVGKFVLPREQLDELEVLTAKQNRFALMLDLGERLTPETLRGLVWHLRLNYFQDRLIGALSRDQTYFQERSEGLARPNGHHSHVPAVLFELFKKVGIVTPDGVSKVVRSRFKSAYRSLRKKETALPPSERYSERMLTQMAAILCFLQQVHMVGAKAAPRPLLDIGGERLAWLLTRRST